MLTDSELERRRPVWRALSELWLDTELDDRDLARIADVAAASGYTIPELTDIYLYEVAPVVYPNCWIVAGEWVAFDNEWLCAAAHRNAEHRSLWLRFWVFVRVGRWLMTHATEHHWRRIVSILTTRSESLRSDRLT